MLELNPGMMIWTWITFFILLAILYKTALKPLLSAISDRENNVRNDLDEAKKQREEAEELVSKHKKMIADADAEAQKVLKEAQSLAQKAREEILDKARQESALAVEKAKQEIEKQRDDAIKALKTEVVDLAIGAAEKILTQAVDKEANKKVVDDYIASMPKSLKN
ncbi:MAG: F0F1 ATP synthase subunit B [Calditrichaeota bacterium]|nr:F0F1 ATP synthase subunit B [Calditrichota bacterium]